MQKEILEYRFNYLCNRLLVEKNTDGFWSGRLSSSALSTAIAIVAIKIHGDDCDSRIEKGCTWLSDNINTDGGYGDTPGSESNVSTSLICFAAISYCLQNDNKNNLLKQIEKFLTSRDISITPAGITRSVLDFYGKDYTFSVPILSLLVICGVLPDNSTRNIPQLPFELSLLPSSLYRFFNMQVVSYAIPALIGVGIFLNSKVIKRVSFTRFYRNRCVKPSLRKLNELMPESGGFLEAIPLTGFVCMCLTASGNDKNRVVSEGIRFLENQQRTDGSWPIDTDLSTWVTTLSVKALGPQLYSLISTEQIKVLKEHLLGIQYKETHPFNGAEPGGWGWTNFTGSVPDADDTPGAILALLAMNDDNHLVSQAVLNGCRWLMNLQNSDGGFPTFCKGWGKLPFDSSCADLTGHALLAFVTTLDKLGEQIPVQLKNRIVNSALHAVRYLRSHQNANGSWYPLWFGNQYTGNKKNPVYGTAKVSVYLADCLAVMNVAVQLKPLLVSMTDKANNYLLLQQNDDGSWGGEKGVSGTVEETALAVAALAECNREAGMKGLEWLEHELEQNDLRPAPIGLYFAALWYDEKLYPLIYYIEALRRIIFNHPGTHPEK